MPGHFETKYYKNNILPTPSSFFLNDRDGHTLKGRQTQNTLIMWNLVIFGNVVESL